MATKNGGGTRYPIALLIFGPPYLLFLIVMVLFGNNR